MRGTRLYCTGDLGAGAAKTALVLESCDFQQELPRRTSTLLD